MKTPSPVNVQVSAMSSQKEVADGFWNCSDDKTVDPEVSKYISDQVLEINDETNKRLKRLIDKRILATMMITYFFQSLDKSALPMASVMGITTDANLVGQQV
jgi:hypothetical protein